MSDLTKLSLIETINALKEKKFSEEELNKAYLERIRNLNPSLNAYLEVQKNITGIPVAIKDIISTKDITTTAGSKILEKYIPPYNATVVERLLQNNIRINGKTNLDEFAMGASGENSAFGSTKNPWDLTKVPGGSSSGSAVAVAADMCVFALGTDTGGSIRQPASLCGVVGLKPSYGRVSRYGLIAMASSFDQAGIFSKTVADARLVLSWIAGSDGYDSNVVAEFKIQPFDYAQGKNSKFKNSIKNLKVGVPQEYFGEGLDKGVEKVVKEAIKKLEDLGAEIVEVSLPNMEYGIATYYVLITSEVSSNMGRFDGIRYGSTRENFGPEVKRRIMLGTYALSSGYYDDYFAKAAKVRTLIRQDFEKAFQKCDVIAGPVSPTVAWNLGEKVNDPLKMYLSDVYTVMANLAGIPGISVPCGFSDPSTGSGQVGLPVGLQILGKYLDEGTILDVAEVYEQNTEWHLKKPNLSGESKEIIGGKGDE